MPAEPAQPIALPAQTCSPGYGFMTLPGVCPGCSVSFSGFQGGSLSDCEGCWDVLELTLNCSGVLVSGDLTHGGACSTGTNRVRIDCPLYPGIGNWIAVAEVVCKDCGE